MKNKKAFVAVNVIAILLALSSLALFAVVVFVPKLVLHADTYIVESTSMQPNLNPGDIVIADPGYKVPDLKIGDVVTYLTSNLESPFGSTMIVHRIVSTDHNSAEDSYQFITKGDNNKYADPPIGQLDITGRVLYSVPWVGIVIDSPYSKLILAVIAILLLLVVARYIRLRKKFTDDNVRP